MQERVLLSKGKYSLLSSPTNAVFKYRAPQRTGITLYRKTGPLTLGELVTIPVHCHLIARPPVGITGGNAQHARSCSPNDDRWCRLWPGYTPGLDHLIMLPSHSDTLFSPESLHDLERFLQFGNTLLSRGKGIAISPVLFLGPSRTESQDQTTTTHILKSGRHFSHQTWITKRLIQYQVAKT